MKPESAETEPKLWNKRKTFFILPVLGVLYLSTLASKGTHNTIDFVDWIQGFIHGDFYSLYHVIPNVGVLETDSLKVPYPPFSLYVLGMVGKLLVYFLGESRTILLLASNLTSVVFTFLTATLLYFGAKSRNQLNPFLYLLTPAVFLISPILGYQDSIMSFFILATLICAAAEKFYLAGLLGALAIFSKQLAVMPIFGLVCLILLSKPTISFFKFILGFTFTASVVLYPFLTTGTILAYLRGQSLASVHTMMSAQNPNFPWLLSVFVRIAKFGLFDKDSYSALPFTIENPQIRQVCYLSFGAVTVGVFLLWLVYWTKIRKVRGISPLFAGAVAICAYNLFSFGVHENHVFMACPIMFAIANTPSLSKSFTLLSSGLGINLLATGGLGLSISWIQPLTTMSGPIYSAISLCVFGLYLWAFKLLVATKPIIAPKGPHN